MRPKGPEVPSATAASVTELDVADQQGQRDKYKVRHGMAVWKTAYIEKYFGGTTTANGADFSSSLEVKKTTALTVIAEDAPRKLIDGQDVVKAGSDKRSAFAGPVITVHLQPDGSIFTIHRKVLGERCYHFDKILNHEKDGESVIYSLPCGSKRSFSIILKWIYTNSVHYVKDESDVLHYIEATSLALELGIWDALDPLHDRVQQYFQHNTINGQVAEAIQTLPNDCKLYGLLLTATAYQICRSLKHADHESLCEFDSFIFKGGQSVLSLVRELARRSNYIDDITGDIHVMAQETKTETVNRDKLISLLEQTSVSDAGATHHSSKVSWGSDETRVPSKFTSTSNTAVCFRQSIKSGDARTPQLGGRGGSEEGYGWDENGFMDPKFSRHNSPARVKLPGTCVEG